MLDANDDGAAPASLKPQPGGVLTPLYIVERRKGQDPGRWRNFFISASARYHSQRGLRRSSSRHDAYREGVYLLEVHAETSRRLQHTIELPLVAD
jgi:hypothetical protein